MSGTRLLQPWNNTMDNAFRKWKDSNGGYMDQDCWERLYNGDRSTGRPMDVSGSVGLGGLEPTNDYINLGFVNNASKGAVGFSYDLKNRALDEWQSKSKQPSTAIRAWNAPTLGNNPSPEPSQVFGLLTYARCGGSDGSAFGQTWDDSIDPQTGSKNEIPERGRNRAPGNWPNNSNWNQRLGDDKVECPNGECRYSFHSTRSQYQEASGSKDEYKMGVTFANKTQWDSAYRVPCCLQMFNPRNTNIFGDIPTSVTTGNNGTKDCDTYCGLNMGHPPEVGLCTSCIKAVDQNGTGQDIPCNATADTPIQCTCVQPKDANTSLASQTLLCDPGWNDNNCADAIRSTCSALDVDGKTPLLAKPSHPCNEWYKRIKNDGFFGSNAWIAADEMVDEICTKNPDIPQCSCYTDLACTGGSCVPYTQIPGEDGGYYGVAVNSAINNKPLNLVDPACLKRSCATDDTKLLSSSQLTILRRCPTVCYQVRKDDRLTIDQIQGGFEIQDDTMQCSTDPVVPIGKPKLKMDSLLAVPLQADDQGNVKSWVPLISTPVSVFNVGAASGTPAKVTVTTSGLPKGINVSYSNESVDGQSFGSVVFEVDETNPPKLTAGKATVITVKATDSVSGSKAETKVQLSPALSSFKPPLPSCDTTKCAPSTQVVTRVEETTPVAYAALALGIVVFLISGAFFFSTVWEALHGPSGQERERRRELLANPLR